jgi:hypothetical protein
MFTRLARLALPLAFLAPALPAQQELIYLQFGNTTGIDTDVESCVPGLFGKTWEVADDFELVGRVERLFVSGNDCFGCVPPVVAGAHVRFYEATAAGPGALLQESFVPAGGAALQYDVLAPSTLEITLPVPFEATGAHFLAVQLEFAGPGYWGWWTANYTDGPHGSPLVRRAEGGSWETVDTPMGPLDTDLSFALWGVDDTPPGPGSDPHGTWAVMATPDPVTEHAILRDVEVIAADDAWAVGEWTDLVLPPWTIDTKPLAMHWDGTAWSLVEVPFKNFYVGGNWCDLSAVRAAGPDDVWAAGSNIQQAPDGYAGTHLFVTHWNGSAWTEVPAPVSIGGSGNFVDDIAIVAPDDIWFVGDWIDTQGGMGLGLKKALTMHWDGSSFAIVENPFFDNKPIGGHGLTSISALASDDIWAVGGGHDGDYVGFSEIIHWNGSTWTHVPGPTPGWYHRLSAVEAIAPDDVWASGDYQDDTGYHAFFIHWDGSSWSMVDADAPAGGASLVAFGPDEVYSSGGGIARWDGQAWTEVAGFSTVLGPALVALDAAGTPETMWATGREIVVDALLSLAVRLVGEDGWTTVPVSAGDAAPAPLLAGEGLLQAGTPVLLTLAGAPPVTPTLLVVGASSPMLPFKGSLLAASPDVLIGGLVTDEAGRLVLPATWPPGVPVGTSAWMQAWSHGTAWTASDGLRATVP